jgi:phosphoribosylanthranilate isomerase
MSDKNDRFEVELDGKRYSLPRHCPHRGGLLDFGYLNRAKGTVTCPLHRATFDVRTGRRLSGPPCEGLDACLPQSGCGRPQGPIDGLPPTDLWDRSPATVRVKLCEFESLDAAWSAAELGAHGLGFHLFKTQNVGARVRQFRGILRRLPARLDKVLLTDLEFGDLAFVLDRLLIDTVQLYPDWDPAEVLRLRAGRRLRVLKVMSALPEENCADDEAFLARYAGSADGILLDSRRRGGTGVSADWAHCAEVVRRSPIPVFLAGGLTAENVGRAVAEVRPFGVDVETGVSDRIPGGPLVKNSFKIAAFLESAKAAAVAGG